MVEVSENLAGPFAARILGELGADVIKVERPQGGDPARRWGPPNVGDDGAIFAFANRNKRSIVLDLRDDDDRAALRGLAAQADVFIESLRPGALEALGFGYPELAPSNPGLIYASILAYGEEGPLKDLPGYDLLMQAHGGIMATTGPEGGPPVRAGTSIGDIGSALWMAVAILAALQERSASGKGRRLSVSLFDTALCWSGYHLLGYLADGKVPGPLGTGIGMIAPYAAFASSDGSLMIAAGNDGLFRKLCAVLGLDALADTPQFASNAERVRNRDELATRIEGVTRSLPTATLLERLRAGGVPTAPVLAIDEVARDPQTRASGMLVTPEEGSGYPSIGIPIRIDGVRPPTGSPPPRLGEDSPEFSV